MMTGIAVEIDRLYKDFGAVQAIQALDLQIATAQILALIGPSGCGKTTLLRLLAGFERPDSGVIRLGGRTIVDENRFIPPEARGVGMVFQDYALFPHLSVMENVAFGLQRLPKARRREKTEDMLHLVGLGAHFRRYPHELSGGERQRVALARALAPRPVLLLMDEPFSNLDADRRSQMREEVRRILKDIHATAIFVTHDQEEALFMGDCLAILKEGRLQQVGSPENVFHQPATRFVAEFMGQTIFLPGIATAAGIQTEIGLVNQRAELPEGSAVELAVRADDISFEPHPDGSATVIGRDFKGAVNIYRLALPSNLVLHSLQPHTRLIAPGTAVRVFADPRHNLACFHNGTALPTNP